MELHHKSKFNITAIHPVRDSKGSFPSNIIKDVIKLKFKI